ncbi:antitoxin VbhA family protein [Pseudomonas alliivorans]|nr:antitoxin VbhA family protein [Pseudomonas alliivorans]MEE4711031.1 antitoxin VbhA family protein [Pseudomonas alliivorans]MEE4728517.1 antitoxin VbhA family protein [Pseudomonas alliivorans]MEE4769842.1 antitoxin VbhA family protein [Pseudomonas alliivorans]
MDNSVDSKFSDAKRTHRKNAVDYARASLALEGLLLSPAEEQRAEAFVSGELTLAEFIGPDDKMLGC